MKALKALRKYLLACSLVVFLQPLHGLAARQNPAPSNATPQSAPLERDAQHDFDFEMGSWKTHISRLQHPLSGSDTWVEYQGTSVVRKVWNGHANLVQLEVDGSAGHIEGLSLRLYDPISHQWSLNFANSNSGRLSQPTIGEFRNGRGEFFDLEESNGRTILVRNVWWDITPDSCRFEQAFSEEGGKSWEVNWIATDTRVKDESDKNLPNTPPETVKDGQHDFDFELGSWDIHLKRLLHPLTGSTTWVRFDGGSFTQKVWNGRSQLEEFETDGAQGHIEGLTLRLYNRQSHQWSLYWANSKDGITVAPQVGEFKNGRGEFYGQDTLNGKAILIRFVWSDATTNTPHFEQSFSTDGGKSWEVNWITDQTRVNDESDKAH